MGDIDAIELLLQDHRTVRSLFEQLDTGGNDREELARRLVRELAVHAKVEEELVYPAARKALPDEGATIDEGIQEHAWAKELAIQLEGLTPDDTEFDRVVGELKKAMLHHIEEEEGEVIPKFREVADEKALQQLGRQAIELKEQAMAAQTADADEEAAGVDEAAGGGSGKLSELPKEELYERARQAGIEGRSKMSPEELARALESRQ